MKVAIKNCYSILIRLLPFSLISYPTIQLFNLLLIALVFIDFVLSNFYASSCSPRLVIRKDLNPFIGSSAALIYYLLLNLLILPVYTIVATTGILLRALSIILVVFRERVLSSNLYAKSYQFGLVSACFLSIFNDRLNLFPVSINSNSLSMTIVAYTLMYSISSSNDNFPRSVLNFKHILLIFVGIGMCGSRGVLIGLIMPTIALLSGLSIRSFISGTIRKQSISIAVNFLLILGLLLGSFGFWYIFGGEYSVNRINSLLTLQAQKGTGDTKRLVLLQNAAASVYAAPLFGHGSGYTKFISFTNNPDDKYRSIHNTYLTIAVDYGLLGLFLFLSFISTALFTSPFPNSSSRSIFIAFFFVVAIFNDIIASPAFLLSIMFLSPSKSK